jgi:hypothetical protein
VRGGELDSSLLTSFNIPFLCRGLSFSVFWGLALQGAFWDLPVGFFLDSLACHIDLEVLVHFAILFFIPFDILFCSTSRDIFCAA